MKKWLLLLVGLNISVYFIRLNAQTENDYIWILGNTPNIPEEYFGGVMLDFHNNIISPEYFNIFCDPAEPAVLSSNSGILLAYSDGCKIYNSHHEVMNGGDSISYGAIWESYCEFGYPGTQNNLLLPWPGDSMKAIMFHVKVADDFSTHYLLYSIIQFTEDNPTGIVIEKNKLLLDPGTSSLITATKHGNGRDWWIVFPEDQTNRFFFILLDPYGVSIIDTQSIGTAWGPREWASQAIFSPDGKKYIRFNPWKGLDIFDFDRCTGHLSNSIESGPLTDPIEVGGGVAMSSDSRYLYVSNNIYLYQYDMLADDILASKVLIDVYDGYQNPFSTTFYQMALGPDGKIYVFATNGVKSIHVIHHPERYGNMCGFIQHDIELPAYVDIGSVNIPYYRLGSEDGSQCDTLGINNLPVADFRYEIDTLNPLQVYFKNRSYFLPETYSWSFGNGMVSNLENPLLMDYTSPGQYKVCLEVANSYGHDSFCRIISLKDSVTSNYAIENRQSFAIYPNPFENEINVTVNSHMGELSLRIYSAVGIKVLQQKITSTYIKIPLPSLPNGVYYYFLSSNGHVIENGKILKNGK